MTPPRRICVFCGSNPGAREAYREAARALGEALVARGLGLVYGGASVGVMGTIADTVMACGGEAVGVIPEALVTRELAHSGLSALHVVSSMHERKAKMAELADGFIALPGGFGTLEETFEVLTWAQLGIHGKPCALLDVAGYFADLFRFLDHAVAEKFVKPEHRRLVILESDPAALLDAMIGYAPPHLPKWIDPSET